MLRRYHGSTTRAVFAALLATGVLVGCTDGSTGASSESSSSGTPTAVAQAQRTSSPVDPAIVAADNTFGLSLLDSLLPGMDGRNIAISPLSVALALQVLYNGASGSTQQAMSKTLQLGTLSIQTLDSDNAALQASLIDPDPQVKLTIANSLWIDQGGGAVLPSFTQMDETYYGATIGDLAGAPANVNAWVDSETDGLIPAILPPGKYQDTIIANVLYFNGQWTTSFDPSDTTAGPFTLSDGSQTSTELMHQTGSFAYTAGSLHGSNFQAVRMLYGQGRLSMFIVLPNTGIDVTTFVSNMTIADLTGLIAQLQDSTVTLTLPRFTSSYATSLTPALGSLGMAIAFGPSADFSALAPGFWVNVVIHKTLIEVDETGTVAAAATGIGEVDVMAPQVAMTMDHPFFYAIQDDKTGELLFIGILMNPNLS